MRKTYKIVFMVTASPPGAESARVADFPRVELWPIERARTQANASCEEWRV